jgi:hypothetical protein
LRHSEVSVETAGSCSDYDGHLGAGLAMWLVPRVAELRNKLTESLDDVGNRASEQFQQASARVGETVDQIARKGQGVRDDVAEAVARGAREVERYATVVQTERR